MARRRWSLLPDRLTPRSAASAVLLSWLLGLLGPLFHRHEEHAAAEGASAAAAADHDGDSDDGHRHVGAAASHCSGQRRDLGAQPAFVPECSDGDDCRDPFHHHHAHPTAAPAALHCSICASLFERTTVEVALPAMRAPLPQARLLARAAPPSPAAQRTVFYESCGPPEAPASASSCDRPDSADRRPVDPRRA